MVIAGLSLFFIVTPIIQSLIQFQAGIKKWRNNADNGSSIHSWLANHLRTIYFVVALTGGSPYAAVILCNSGFLGLPFFEMGLTRRQQRVFRNKRVFSIVLLENLPQFVLQVTFSVYYNEWTFITLFAAVFSGISIFITIFEFCTQRELFQSEKEQYKVLTFTVKSRHIGSMNHKEFRDTIQHKRKKIERDIAKILHIGAENVELLKPIQVREGVLLTFHILSHATLTSKMIQGMIEQENQHRQLAPVKLRLVRSE